MAAHAHSIEHARPQGAAIATIDPNEIARNFPAVPASDDDAKLLDAELLALMIDGRRHYERIAIFAHRCDIADLEGRSAPPEDEAKLDEAHDGYRRAFQAAMQFTPRTAAGLRAKAAWLAHQAASSVIPGEELQAFPRSALASPALAERA